jgi:hypothetical protein
MPELRLWMPSELTVHLDRAARALLLSRREYARAILAAVARELAAEEAAAPSVPPDEREVP